MTPQLSDKELSDICSDPDHIGLNPDTIRAAVDSTINVEISLNLDKLAIILREVWIGHSSSKRIIYSIFDRGHSLWNTNFLHDTAKEIISLHQWWFSNGIMETRSMLDYTISERGYIGGYMSLEHFREDEIDGFIETELRSRWLNDEQISDLLISKPLRKSLEEYNTDVNAPDFEEIWDEFVLSINQKKELFLSSISEVLDYLFG